LILLPRIKDCAEVLNQRSIHQFKEAKAVADRLKDLEAQRNALSKPAGQKGAGRNTRASTAAGRPPAEKEEADAGAEGDAGDDEVKTKIKELEEKISQTRQELKKFRK